MANHGKRTPPAMAVGCALAMTALAVATPASAFDLRQTSQGQPLRWDAPRVSYVVDPSIEAGVAGGSAAAATAARGWNDSGGAPNLLLTAGPGGAQPGLDGQNSILFAPKGFAPAGRALAVTITSFDQASGEIVDTDIVVNGVYSFRVLAAGSEAATGASPIATDGSAHSDDDGSSAPFDLVHVLSHELGHSLGLGDETASHTALMYAYTMPGDASVRAPSPDDVAGVEAIYTPAAPAMAGAAAHAGCGQASVAGGNVRGTTASWVSVLVVLAAAGWLVARRRGARVAGSAAIPVSAAFVMAWAGPGVLSGARPLSAASDARARVVALSTTSQGGVFETTVELAPTQCRTPSRCPSRARAHVWGGTLGGITQRIGEDGAPLVGDEVDLQFFASGAVEGAPSGASDGAVDAEGVPRATLLTTRR